MDIESELKQIAPALGIELSDFQCGRLALYVTLLRQWNTAYNLVGTSDISELLRKHLLDCIAISPYVTAKEVLDVGSGAGLPGIPLAITLPGQTFTLLDANAKKTRFMRQVTIELKLENVQVVQSRVETYRPDPLPGMVTARALAPVQEILPQLLPLCAVRGAVLLMLGRRTKSFDLQNQPANICYKEIQVPGLTAQRHLLIATRSAA